MNKEDNSSQSDGSEATGLPSSAAATGLSKSSENHTTMKRTKEKIEQYFHQVTKGCGKDNCENEDCASNPKFQPLDPNKAAAKALRLYQSNAKLCENRAFKLHRQSSESGAASQVIQQPTKLALFEEPSTSSAVTRTALSPTTSAEKPPIELQLDELLHVIDLCQTGHNWQPLIKLIGQVFSSADALKNSFCQAGELQIEAVEKAFESILTIEETSLKSSLQTALSSLCLQLDVDMRVRGPSLENDPQFLNVFRLVFELPMLYRVSDSSVSEGLISSLCKAAAHLSLSQQAKIAKCWSQACVEKLRRLLQVLHQAITDRVLTHLQNGTYQDQSPEIESLQEDDAIAAGAKIMNMLYYACLLGGRCDSQQILAREKEVNQQDEGLLLGFWENDDPQEEEKSRSILNIVNPLGVSLSLQAIDCRQPKLAHNEFLNDVINEHIHMERDFINFKVSHEGGDSDRDPSTRRTKFSFLDYPFLLTCANKVVALTYDNRIRMYREQRQAIITSLFHSTPFMSPFLRLSVRRDHLIEDALSGLELIAMQDPAAFKKQLHVEFDGEQGLDEGGLSKEFFQLITEQLLNQDFGMFVFDTTTNQLWFNPIPFESEREFSLIGMLLGLAIYNGIILNVSFPNVLYRKLLGKIGALDDLQQSHPIIYRSLKQMLDYDGDDFMDTFMVPFQVAYNDVCGNTVTYDLILDGSRHLVIQENKALFADLYADYLLNQSIDRQFRAFKRGFQLVTEESPLRWLFRPDEVELLVCGRQGELHFSEMEETTRYDGGFSPESDTVKNLWSVLHSLSQDEKRLFLQFTTGSDRIPVGGLSKLKLVVARNGPDSERLPTAHTCFNVLLLPDYPSLDKLREKLLKAIQNAKGFGMM